jgi:hypothetical protein
MVAGLHSTRYDNSKGSRIDPSLFYTSELHSKNIPTREGSLLLIKLYYLKRFSTSHCFAAYEIIFLTVFS